MAKSSTHHTDHEGARESLTPGEPREREIITPGWAELDKRAHKGDKPAKVDPARNRKKKRTTR
jgi:hypothetical protein